MSKAPNGRTAVMQFYGNPRGPDGNLSASWARANLVPLQLPYKMRLAWDTASKVSTVTMHRKCADSLFIVLNEIYLICRREVKRKYPAPRMREQIPDPNELTAWYDYRTELLLRYWGLDLLGGTFNYRKTRRGSKLSTHAFGCAIDIDPKRNPMGGHKTHLPDFVFSVFCKHGWKCGIDFNDPMHFQYAHGY